ncbi:MAG: efflux RND transporter periplasmic adaptor subunit [Candidatus Eisenbacteria bacterium]|nr:efflux RND transporter periplasmic adaptor subunit [Candidatus Eisenbacteria bacterium]
MNRHLLLLLPALVFPLAGCTRTDAAPGHPAETVAVRVAAVTAVKLALPVTATGTLVPKDGANLSFKVGGLVARVLVNEGDRVRAGQLLAQLDLGEIEPGVTRAAAAAEKAERDHRRLERLYADSVATLSQLQDAGTARDAARAEYEAARFNRSHAVIVAPASGMVLRRLAEPGEVVAAGMPVLAFGSHARGQVLRAGLADRDFVRVRLGDRATVRFDAIPGREFQGTVTELGNASDPATGTYRVEVSLPGAAALASGLVGSVEIRPRAESAVTLVPVEALLEADGDAATVYTLAPDGRRAERREVRLAFLDGGRAAIRSGLEGARLVVTEGAGRIGAGDRVEVMK